MTARRAALLHLSIIAAVAIGYVAIRVAIAPTVGPLRGQATDLLAGMALPSLFALFLPAGIALARWASTLSGKLSLTLAAAFVWEVAVPLLGARSTPDLLDVVAYLAGTLLQHALVTRLPGMADACG